MGSKLPYRHLAAFAALVVVGIFSVGQSSRVPLLWRFDLGMHELGHLIGYILPIPEVAVAAAGSFAQVVVPLGLAVYFAVGFRNHVAGAVCLAWAAASLQDVSIYVGDAPFERLPLIGGRHDWAFILGPEGFDQLAKAEDLAGIVRVMGIAMLLLSIVLVAVDLWRDTRPTGYLEMMEGRQRAVTALDWE
jgi:hypothetical protein